MKIKIGARDVTVKELTVGDIREYLKLEESDIVKGKAIDPVTDLMLEDMSLRDIVMMTDLSIEDVDVFTSRELLELVKACREWNPGFFTLASQARRLMDRLTSQLSTPVSPR